MRWFGVAIIIGLTTTACFGQFQVVLTPATADPANTPQPSPKDAPIGVSVPDSPGANDLLAKADEKEQQHQWKAAAEFYKEVLDKYDHRVIPAHIDSDAGTFQYSGVALLVQQRLAHWPDEGLNVYRSLYGQTAADALSAAGRDDAAGLEKVFWNYFPTDAGKTAGIDLIDMDLEAGRFAAAAWIGQRLLDLHPSIEPQRAMVLFRTAAACQWAGDAAHAAELLIQLRDKYPHETGSVGGHDVILADALAKLLNSPNPTPTAGPREADTWPNFGGPADDAGVSPSTARPGASITKIALIPPNLSGIDAGRRGQYEQADENDLTAGAALGIMPVADDGAIFFQDGRHLYAVSADNGAPLAAWQQTYPTSGAFTLNAPGRARNQLLTVSVNSTAVLAVMGQNDPLFSQIAASPTKLVCLDRETGKQLWTAQPSQLPQSVGPLHDAEYCGAAVAVEGSVLIAAQSGKDKEFEDCYIVSLSLKTGQYQWSTYIGSASESAEEEIGLSVQSSPQMTLSQGRLFVLSNLGVVAALDANDGGILWLTTYPRSAPSSPQAAAVFLRLAQNQSGQNTMPGKPWAQNPLVVSGENIFALPADGRNLLVYDRNTGDERKRIGLSDYDNADVLLGVRGNDVVLTTSKDCYCIDWTAYDPSGDAKNAIVWESTQVVDTLPGPENIIFGRGFLTRDSVFFPTRHRLYQLDWAAHGKVRAEYPSHGGWNGGEEPGNLLVTAQNVVVAGSTRVDVYTELDLVRQRCEDLIAAAPDDPRPRIDFAAALFNAGQPQAGLEKLDEAINLIGGVDTMRPGDGRQLIYSTALEYARHGDDSDPQTVIVTDALFDRAGAAADSPVQKAVYRLARAQHEHSIKNYASEVRLCQEILSDQPMRDAVVSETSTAGAAAESAIGDAMRLDSSSYTGIEQAASDALAAAKTTGDPARMLAVAAVFPNSNAAVHARSAAAQLLESAGDHTEAIATLQQLYASAARKDRGVVLESIARNYLALPDGAGAAIDRLACAIRLGASGPPSEPFRLSDGTSLHADSLSDVLTALRQVAADRDRKALPDFHIPTVASAGTSPFLSVASIVENVTAMIQTPRDFSRTDRVITWSPDGLSAFAPAQTQPLWTAGEIKEQPIGAAWQNQSLAVWTAQQIWLLRDNGKSAWRSELHGLSELALASSADAINDIPPADDQNPAIAQQQEQIMVNGGIIRRAIILNGGGMAGRQFIIRNGVLQVIGPPANAPANPAEEGICSVLPAGNRLVVGTTAGRLLGIDVADGHIGWQIHLSDTQINQLRANPHFVVVRFDDAEGAELVVLRTVDGQVIGRRKFPADSTTNQLVNFALSEDGTLAYTLSTKIFVKDLYEPWKVPSVELTSNGDNAPFVGMANADQLLVRQGRLFALYDGGKFVRVHDLANGGGFEPIGTGADSDSVSMQTVGSRLFVVNDKTYRQYNLDDIADHYEGDRYDINYAPHIRQMFLGRDQAILLNDPIDRGPAGSPLVMLLIYSRAQVSAQVKKESGVLSYTPSVHDDAGILTWQACDGALAYVTADQKLHWLRGAGTSP